MKRLLFFWTLLLSAGIAQAQVSSVYAARLQEVLDSVCVKNKIKGISAAVYVPGSGVWKGAYGESHAGVPITTDMVLPIGSNTKTFVAAMILQLQQNGQLSLDDTIGTWLQNIPNVNGQITIRQMLNHTSGLYSYTNHPNFTVELEKDFNHVFQPEDMFQFIDVPSFAPGTDWEYSNTNYLLAGLIIKKIKNEPFDASVRNMILTPQGFNNTYTYPQETPAGIIPHGWKVMYAGHPQEDLQVSVGYTNVAFLSMASAAGAIVSTAEDNVLFWNKLMTGQIINNNSLTEMKDCYKVTSTFGYGLGIMQAKYLNGRVVYAHGGTCFGYLNENIADTVSGICITVLSNQDSVDNNMLLTRLVNALHKVTMSKTSVAYVSNVEEVNIYPVPAKDVLYVNNENGSGNMNLMLRDVTGRVVLNKRMENKEPVSLHDIPAGLYIGTVTEAGRIIATRKIEITK